MRVIAGEFRSRRLKSVEGPEVRPTPDRLRETLFNVIAPEIEDAVFVDAYAGTGAVGIEALSRGAKKAIFLEKNRKAADVIADNLASLGLQPRSQIIRGSAKIYLGAQQADILFIDPPYDRREEYREALEIASESDAKLIVVQHDRRLQLSSNYGKFSRAREIRQGDNQLSFYRPSTVDIG
jgi:16S rRNA (guanine(966)-N(2))-methyltransferase RsmD